MNFDAVVVGAGISGAVLAERLATAGRKVLVLEQRAHLAGNCHDWRDANGLLIHEYGPHIFHTDKPEVWAYLSRFTAWLPYQHRVLASINGSLVPLPFNLNSLARLYPATLTTQLEALLLEEYGFGTRMTIGELRKSTEPRLAALAEFVYDKVFANYSRKQWGLDPASLDPQVTGRVPVSISRDDRYFQDPWQAIPDQGYTTMIGRVLEHPNIKLMLNTRMEEVLELNLENGAKRLFGSPFDGLLIYTGMLDALFDYRLGRLPYRSLRFERIQVDKHQRLPVAVVNYPNDHDFTRITDFGHFIGRSQGSGCLMREYPQAWDGSDQSLMPYYPIFNATNQALFEQYHQAANALPGFHLLGRLAEYKYYDMDDAVEAALRLAEIILKKLETDII